MDPFKNNRLKQKIIDTAQSQLLVVTNSFTFFILYIRRGKVKGMKRKSNSIP